MERWVSEGPHNAKSGYGLPPQEGEDVKPGHGATRSRAIALGEYTSRQDEKQVLTKKQCMMMHGENMMIFS